jgi:hypothetical protein
MELYSSTYVRTFLTLIFLHFFLPAQAQHRVIISTDIGGTDDDDFQSMIHYLMYADQFHTEGLISSAFGDGRVADIHHILNLYEQDYPALKAQVATFPHPDELRAVTKQGAIDRAPFQGFSTPTEGSEWIIDCARRKEAKPLWVLVWGGLEDLAQALHDAPDIQEKIRVYWIGGPNKKWSANAYHYIVNHFPNLHMIEANATYRGLFVDDRSDEPTNLKNFYRHHIKGRGALGTDFINYYKGVIKMGDTPSVAYLMHGDPEHPAGESWGGSFVPLNHSPYRIYNRATTLADTVPTFSLQEWVFDAPAPTEATEQVPFWLEIADQRFEGEYLGNGLYKVRFVTKSPGKWQYTTISTIRELDGLKGQFVSVDPWPGKPHKKDIQSLKHWWSDDPDPKNFKDGHQGAKTIYKWQKEFLLDWAKRWAWLEEE